MKEEVLNGRAVYEEMIANFGMDHDMFKKFGHTDRDDGT